SLKIRIYYEDTDCGGVVYYANYLRYFERARTELLREAGIELSPLADQGTFFVVTRAGIDYKAPAKYQDLLRIETTITKISRTRLTFFHEVFDEKDGLAVQSEIVLACVSRGRPTRIPQEILSRLS
ncbi:MAG TPA: YbgC/FadM family acyl-CoA thioesterase, partial [Nitrospiria bacterium]|nr:YbgC/FadM family acyl-CoA thioesterase [Nitrospiria bacterium]